MANRYLSPIDLTKNELQNAVIANLAGAPLTPVDGQVYYDTTLKCFRCYSNSNGWLSLTPDVTRALFDANTILKADSDDTPIALTIGEQTIVGRITGGTIAALTATQVKTLLAIVHTEISDFDTGVRENRLDQMSAPNASVGFNSQKITSLADPVNPQDAATKAYVDGAASGLDIHPSVRAATTANVDLSAPGAKIDNVSLVQGNRVLVKNQTAPNGEQNGIYIWDSAITAMTRATDADVTAEVTAGLFVFVEEGDTQADTGWVLTTDNPIVLNTTDLTFTQFSGAGTYTAGTGITITGSVIATKGVAANVGNNSDLAITVTHNLGSRDVNVQLYDAATYDTIYADTVRTTINSVTLTFTTAPGTNAYRVVITSVA